jgi:single-stranded-DNA-specific exonuclease
MPAQAQIHPPAELPNLSAMGQTWQFPADSHTRTAAMLAQSLGLPPVVASILAARGFDTPEKVAPFLNPRLEHLPDPSSLKDMNKALAVLIAALEQGQNICIFGDYDVDGTCATAMLTRYFTQLGIQVARYIPDRLTEGYGPNPAAMQAIAAQGTQLLITVDTGTNAPEALQAAAAAGVQVIVTDHHPPSGALPPAAAILNPQRADDVSSLRGLCGSGVAFFLLMALNRALRQQGYFTATRPEPKLTELLDLVALATVADVMPLTGANRILVTKGLQQLASAHNTGLAALAQVAGANNEFSAYTLGFVLGPRLNAAGRIESAEGAVKLLLATTETEAYPHAQALHALNAERQQLEKATVAEALQQAESQLTNPAILAPVLFAPHWHPGVVGIVASRVKEKIGRPCFVLGTDAKGHAKGSGRSSAGLDLGAAVGAAQQFLLSGGGHAAAAGVSLVVENLEKFQQTLNQALWAQLQARPTAALPLAHQLAPTQELSASVSPAQLAGEGGLQLANQLQQLAPFGMGNPEPVLHLPHVVVQQVRAVGADQSHYRVRLASPTGGPSIEAMAFGAAGTPLGQLLQNSGGRAIQLALTIKARQFNGRPMVDLVVKDGFA